MLKWFLNEPKKVVEEPPMAVKFFNNTLLAFMPTGSWVIYTVALCLIGISLYFFHADMQRRSALSERNREPRVDEKPPQKRRPGVPIRNHEIFRNFMGIVQRYEQPTDKKYVLQFADNGAIYGTLTDKEKWIMNRVKTTKADKATEVSHSEILNENTPETSSLASYVRLH